MRGSFNQCRNGGKAVPLTPLFFAKILHLKGSRTRRTSVAHEKREDTMQGMRNKSQIEGAKTFVLGGLNMLNAKIKAILCMVLSIFLNWGLKPPTPRFSALTPCHTKGAHF